MSSSGARSGKDGKAVVDGELVTRLTVWTLTEQFTMSEWGDSESEGKANTMPARGKCTGTIGGKFDNNKPTYTVFRAGDQPKLVLWQSKAAKDYWHFASSTIENFAYEYNPDTKEVVGWTASWHSDGAYFCPGESGAPTETLPTS